MEVELEHGSHAPQTDVTGDNPTVTAKIALAHMKEFPDYHERLARMEAEHEWKSRGGAGAPPPERPLSGRSGGRTSLRAAGGMPARIKLPPTHPITRLTVP